MSAPAIAPTTPDTARVLVSIDPGIDRSAAAIWRYDVGQATRAETSELARHLITIRECTAPAADALAARLTQIASWSALLAEDVRRILGLSQFMALAAPRLHDVVIEWPAFAGMYRGRTRQRTATIQPNADAMAKLYAATGAIVAGVSRWTHPEHVRIERASKVARETKQLLARSILEAASLRQARAPNNDDTRSAIYVGINFLTGERRG